MIDDLLSNNVKKLGFVSIWFSFAFALFLLNRYKLDRLSLKNIFKVGYFSYSTPQLR